MLRELIIAAVTTLFIGLLAGATIEGWRKNAEISALTASYDKARGDAEAAARTKEQNWVDQSSALRKNKDAEIAIANRKYNLAVTELRTRQARRSGSEVSKATGTCAGASGSELARGDAEFLAGLAADAAKLNAALNQCEAAYNSLRN